MGFRFRKSIKLGGGFRVNLSKSGIGYSWGAKGYTITRTADGRHRQTVSIPGTGLSYVHETSANRKSTEAESILEPCNARDIEAVESQNISEISSGMYEDVINRGKAVRILFVVLILVGIFQCLYAGMNDTQSWGGWLVFFGIVVRLFGASVIKYTFDDFEKERWMLLRSAWSDIAKSKKLCQITVKASAVDARRSANIEDQVLYEPVSPKGKLPWFIRTNIKPVVITLSDRSLAILPDRFLVFDKKSVAALSYDDVSISLDAVGMLEDGKVPHDAEIIEYRWAYSNKDGSADRRFGKNKQYPVMKYGRITISTNDGLYIQLLCSNEKAADHLYNLLKK